MSVHLPILLEPIVSALLEPLQKLPESAPAHWIVDCTLGGGGHTAALLAGLGRHKLLALDQDPAALQAGRVRFAAEIEQGRLQIEHSRFSALPEILGSRPLLGLLADLGFSSDQIEDGTRGLSFLREGPLDMRLDPTRGLSCRRYLQEVQESELARVIFEYGEERYSRKIAAAILRARRAGQLPETTAQLAELISRSVPPPYRYGRINPATRTFQALRIEINDELGELDALLEVGLGKILPGGRAAFLSFHSLEDRRVKERFRQKSGALFKQLHKKVIEADDAECARNPRARSAKLRMGERIVN